MKTVVPLKDNYSNYTKDEFGSIDQRPKGLVEIFEKFPGEDRKLLERKNLVVYQGRSQLMQRAFNQAAEGWSAATPTTYLSWFALGNGGTLSNLLIPIVPKSTDTDLTQKIIINSTASTCIDSGKYHPFDSVSFLEDASNNNAKLISAITITVGTNDANGPDGTTYYDLNEAGLYVSDSVDPTDFSGPSGATHLALLKMFARVTFSSIRKTSERQIIFLWHIYF